MAAYNKPLLFQEKNRFTIQIIVKNFPINNKATVNTSFYLTSFRYRGLLKWSHVVIEYFSFVTLFSHHVLPKFSVEQFLSLAKELQRRSETENLEVLSDSTAQIWPMQLKFNCLAMDTIWHKFDPLSANQTRVFTVVVLLELKSSFFTNYCHDIKQRKIKILWRSHK